MISPQIMLLDNFIFLFSAGLGTNFEKNVAIFRYVTPISS